MTALRLDAMVGCAGLYKMEKYKADAEGNPILSTRKVVADWFPNLITDQGLERMGANNNYYGYCQVGSGNNTPSFTDTQLQTYVAGTDNAVLGSTNIQPSSPYYASYIVVLRFAVGTAAGNLSEVGMGWTGTSGNLFSRALILDGMGSPTTITILSDEILDVSYEFRVYPPEVDTTGTITIDGVDYDYLARASNVTTYSTFGGGGWGNGGGGARVSLKSQGSGHHAFDGSIGAITAGPFGAQAEITAISSASYSAGSLQNDGTLIWGITAVNIGPYKSVRVRFSVAEFQLEFDPEIPKTSINELQITFRISWSRATIP